MGCPSMLFALERNRVTFVAPQSMILSDIRFSGFMSCLSDLIGCFMYVLASMILEVEILL